MHDGRCNFPIMIDSTSRKNKSGQPASTGGKSAETNIRRLGSSWTGSQTPKFVKITFIEFRKCFGCSSASRFYHAIDDRKLDHAVSNVYHLPYVPKPSSLCPNAATATANTPSPARYPTNRSNGPQRHSTNLTTQTRIYRGTSANRRRGRTRMRSSDQSRGGFRSDSEGRTDNLSWSRSNRWILPYGSREIPARDGYSGLHMQDAEDDVNRPKRRIRDRLHPQR